MESMTLDRSKMETMSMDTFLPPIEKPKGLMMKLAYYFTRRQFGKVLTPLKVHSARLPVAFGQFYVKIGQLVEVLRMCVYMTVRSSMSDDCHVQLVQSQRVTRDVSRSGTSCSVSAHRVSSGQQFGLAPHLTAA